MNGTHKVLYILLMFFLLQADDRKKTCLSRKNGEMRRNLSAALAAVVATNASSSTRRSPTPERATESTTTRAAPKAATETTAATAPEAFFALFAGTAISTTESTGSETATATTAPTPTTASFTAFQLVTAVVTRFWLGSLFVATSGSAPPHVSRAVAAETASAAPTPCIPLLVALLLGLTALRLVSAFALRLASPSRRPTPPKINMMIISHKQCYRSVSARKQVNEPGPDPN